jgi:hypothetical protein
VRTRIAVFLALFTALAVAGCGGPSAEDALGKAKLPSWFTAPADKAEGGKTVRTYVGLPRSAAEVEMVYGQALDRAGWKFHDGGPTCGDKPDKDGCWTGEDLMVTFRASANDGKADTALATSLTVVVSDAP